jgi:hypothetical protein
MTTAPSEQRSGSAREAPADLSVIERIDVVDDPDGRLRDRQLEAVVWLLRRATAGAQEGPTAPPGGP